MTLCHPPGARRARSSSTAAITWWQKVDARSTPQTVQIFCDGPLIASHGRKPAGKQTVARHYPPEKITFQMKTPV